MACLPISRRKLSPITEYYIELDESEEEVNEFVCKMPAIPISPRLEFEYDKYKSTEILKGVLYGFIIGAGIGFYLGRVTKKS